MITLQQPRPSIHGFGVLSLEDVPFLKQILARVASDFEGQIKMLEIGVANGGTTIGVYNHCHASGWGFRWVGLDMECGAPAFDLGDWGKFICGNFQQEQVYEQVDRYVADTGEFNLLFIDGCHCAQCCRLDFIIYHPLLCHGGYLLFHDTCSHPDWQGHHIQCQPDRFIGTREALRILGFSPLTRPDYQFVGEQDAGTTQGMMCFRKLQGLTPNP